MKLKRKFSLLTHNFKSQNNALTIMSWEIISNLQFKKRKSFQMFFYLFISGCRGLCRHAWALVVVCRFHCSAFSCCEAWALGHVGFSSCGSGSVVVVHGLGCPIACGIFMDQGLNPCLLILASEFLTTGSPGKSQRFFLSMSHQEAELRSGTLALL